MRRQLKSALVVAGMSLILAVPANAHSAAEDGGNGGKGTGMGNLGTEIYNESNYRVNQVRTTPNKEVSVYGTGTGAQFLNTNTGTTGTGRIGTNNYTGYGTNTITDNNIRYRTTATTNRGGGWGWLGLLGLIGLAGMRRRNPEGDHR